MHSKAIAQLAARRNAVYIVTTGSDLIETFEGYVQTVFASTNSFLFSRNINGFQQT